MIPSISSMYNRRMISSTSYIYEVYSSHDQSYIVSLKSQPENILNNFLNNNQCLSYMQWTSLFSSSAILPNPACIIIHIMMYNNLLSTIVFSCYVCTCYLSPVCCNMTTIFHHHNLLTAPCCHMLHCWLTTDCCSGYLLIYAHILQGLMVD